MAWMRPRSVSTTRGVKALLTSARSRVWSGGSRNSMDTASPDPSGPPPKRLSNSAWYPLLPKRGSRRKAATSSYRVRT